MKSILIALVVGASMLLSSCATLQQPGGIDDIIKQVQAITRQACAFIPTAQTVANIVAAGQLATAFAIANAICAAVVVPPGDASRRVPIVSGVVIKGTFVRR